MKNGGFQGKKHLEIGGCWRKLSKSCVPETTGLPVKTRDRYKSKAIPTDNFHRYTVYIYMYIYMYIYIYICIYVCTWGFPKMRVPPNHPAIGLELSMK